MSESIKHARHVLDSVRDPLLALRAAAAETTNPLERGAILRMIAEYENSEATVRKHEDRARISAAMSSYQERGLTQNMWMPGHPTIDGQDIIPAESTFARILELGGDDAAITQALMEVGFMPRRDTEKEASRFIAGMAEELPEADDLRAIRDLGRILTADERYGDSDEMLDELTTKVFPRLEESLADADPALAEEVRRKIRGQIRTARADAIARLEAEEEPVVLGDMMARVLAAGGTKEAALQVLENHGYEVDADGNVAKDAPVQEGDICDLCGTEGDSVAVWHTTPFQTTNPAGRTFSWANPWLVCSVCDALVSDGDLHGITEQVKAQLDWDSIPAIARRTVIAEQAKLHQAFLEHKTTREDPPGIGKSSALAPGERPEGDPGPDMGELPAMGVLPAEQVKAMEDTWSYPAQPWVHAEHWPREVVANGRVVAQASDLEPDEMVFMTDDSPTLDEALAKGRDAGGVHMEVLDRDGGQALVYVRGAEAAKAFHRQVSVVSYQVFEARSAA